MAERAVGGDDGHMRDAGDAIVGVENFLFAESYGPIDVHLRDVVIHQGMLFGGIIAHDDGCGFEAMDAALQARDADNFHGGTSVVLGELTHLRKGSHARATPRSPEIEHDDLAPEVGKVSKPIGSGPGKIEFGRGSSNQAFMEGGLLGLPLERNPDLRGPGHETRLERVRSRRRLRIVRQRIWSVDR